MDNSGLDNKCSLCGRSVRPKSGDGRTCEHAGCDVVVCRTCFDIRGRRYCLAHRADESLAESQPAPAAPAADGPPQSPPTAPPPSPAAPEPPAAPEAVAAAEPPAPVGADLEYLRQARVTEMNFISRFQDSLASREELPLPGGDKCVRLKGLPACRTADNAAALKRVYPVSQSVKELRTACPVGPSCRYTLAKGALVIESRSCLAAEDLVSRGRDAAALSLGALLEIVDGLGRETAGGRGSIVCGLFSLTGWSDACIERVMGTASQPALIHANVSVCLIGPKIGQVRSNPSDRRMNLYLSLFGATTIAEEALACRDAMREALLADDRVMLKPYARGEGVRLDAAMMAARDIAGDGDDVELVEIDNVGPVLKWR